MAYVRLHCIYLNLNSDRISLSCLVKLYKDSVEDKIKENIAIGGQEWDSVTRAEVSSNSAVQEGTCYAPINVKPAGRAGGRRGIGRDFDIFQKVDVKFPAPRENCEVKFFWEYPPPPRGQI